MSGKADTVQFNINRTVRVQLTDEGRKLHRQNHIDFWSGINRYHARITDYEPPKEDSEGWSEWQLWSLMEAFGKHLSIGAEVPFATEIQLIGVSPIQSEPQPQGDGE